MDKKTEDSRAHVIHVRISDQVEALFVALLEKRSRDRYGAFVTRADLVRDLIVAAAKAELGGEQ